jgi:hypothetical protein
MARRGLVRLVILAAGLAFTVISSAVAAADADDGAFVVRDVVVDQTADTAAAARVLALAQGQRSAYRRLMARLVPAGATGVPALDSAGIGALIRDFDVAEEKTSAVRYLAKLTYRFKPRAVRSFLRDARVPFAETRSKPVLVLPLFDFEGERLLWDDPNPWREAWYAAPAKGGLVPFVVPYGDLRDFADIDAANALEGNKVRLALIGARYGTAWTMVVLARLSVDESGNSTTLGVTVSQFGAASPEPTTIRQFEAEPEVRRRLAGIAVVMGIELIVISRPSVRIDLSYLGDETRLSDALRAEGLDLARGPLDWMLRLGAAPPATTVIGE